MRASHFIKWSINEDLDLVKKKFERVRGILYLYGTIDCIHVEVGLLKHTKATNYFNMDEDYNYIQAIFDIDKWFLNVFAGFFKVVHDLRVLRNFGFFQLVEASSHLNEDKQQFQGKWIPELIVEDFG
jgi:hypothetical protein